MVKIMTLEDFEKRDAFFPYISKERFYFENDKVKFGYRLVMGYHQYQVGWSDNWETLYQVLLLVDDEYIHPNHDTSLLKEIRFSYCLKSVEKRGKFSEEQLEKVLTSALKIKIENKIKVDKYQKILGILNGTIFFG